MVLKESVKCVSRKFKQRCKGVSKMFNEVLLCNFVLRGSHRSFPSRRRACSVSSWSRHWDSDIFSLGLGLIIETQTFSVSVSVSMIKIWSWLNGNLRVFALFISTNSSVWEMGLVGGQYPLTKACWYVLNVSKVWKPANYLKFSFIQIKRNRGIW